MEKVEQLLASALELPKVDKKRLIDALLYESRVGKLTLDRPQLDLMVALFTATNVKLTDNILLIATPFVKAYGRNIFNTKMEEVQAYIARSSRPNISYVFQIDIMNKVIFALADYIRKRDMLCDAKHVLDNVHMLADAVDVHFPGYADAKVLHMLVRPTSPVVNEE